MLTGRKGSLSSIRAIERHLGAGSVQSLVAWPVARCKLIQRRRRLAEAVAVDPQVGEHPLDEQAGLLRGQRLDEQQRVAIGLDGALPLAEVARRSEEHTSELQSLMRISYAVFCLQKKKTKK